MQVSSPSEQRRNPLRAVRHAQGMTLKETAEAAGLDIGHLSRVERGEASLSLDSLARLAAVLELRSLAEMLGPYRRATKQREVVP
jgi:transcriptional regulator with XRE-family HTH domain